MSLYQLAQTGEVDALVKLLESGESVNSINQLDGCTPIFAAAIGGHLGAVQSLIEFGADVNVQNINGATPLMFAVLGGSRSVVQCLIEAGADIDFEGSGGLTAIGLATSKSPQLAELLKSSSLSPSNLWSNQNEEAFSSTDSEFENQKMASPDPSVTNLVRSSTDDLTIDEATVSSVSSDTSPSTTPSLLTPSSSLTSLNLIADGTIVSSFVSLSKRHSNISSSSSVMTQSSLSSLSKMKLQNIDTDNPLDSQSLSDVTAIELSLVPQTSQTKECNATFRSLLKRKIMGDYLVKRGGMRTNWKTRYFLLTGDHLHYFEPQPGKGSDQFSEPSPTATPLGSIPLHAITGKVHKSDLGIVFGFQVPTAQRIYHFQASSAKRIERWLNVLNANTKRIQLTSPKFLDVVFRVTLSWKDHSISVLRTGREFHTLALQIEAQFPALNPVAFPRDLLMDQTTAAVKEVLSILLEYLKALLRVEDDPFREFLSIFLRDPATDFFAMDGRIGSLEDESQRHLSFSDNITAIALSPLRRSADKLVQLLLVASPSQRRPDGSDLRIYDFDTVPLKQSLRDVEGQVQGVVCAARFSSDAEYFATTTFIETHQERLPNGQTKKVGNMQTLIWRMDSLEDVVTATGTDFAIVLDPSWLAHDLVDLTVIKKKNEVQHMAVVANNHRSVSVWSLEDRSVTRNLTIDAPKGSDGLRMVRFCKADPALVALGGDQGIQVWDHVKNEFIVNIKHRTASLSFSPDGKRIGAVGTYKSKIKFWDVRNGKRIKKLAVGFSTADDKIRHHPHISFHPKNNHMLVCNSNGDVVIWNYNAETNEETPTVVNVEQIWATERQQLAAGGGSQQSSPISSTSAVLNNSATMFPDVEAALQKAKALEAAVYAECRGIVLNIPAKADYARYSTDGSLIITHSQWTNRLAVWLSRNGDLVAEYPTNHKNAQFFSAEISHDGKQLVYMDGKDVYTRALPLDNNGDIVETLDDEVKSWGFVPNHIENDPMIPFHNHQLIIAICENDLAKFKKLCKSFNLNVNFRSVLDGWTPLLLASKLGQPKLVRTLLKHGADMLFCRHIDNLSPLHAAASSSSLKTVMTLVELGANPNSLWDPYYGEGYTEPGTKVPTTMITPLHIASFLGFADIVDFLLSAGADIEGKDSNGRTAIIYACSSKSNLAAVQVLVRRGCDCTVRLRTGTSAIHEAAKIDNQKMVMLLLQEGAGAENERNSAGQTAVDINPQLFEKKSLQPFLRSDTKEFLRYQRKISGATSKGPMALRRLSFG